MKKFLAFLVLTLSVSSALSGPRESMVTAEIFKNNGGCFLCPSAEKRGVLLKDTRTTIEKPDNANIDAVVAQIFASRAKTQADQEVMTVVDFKREFIKIADGLKFKVNIKDIKMEPFQAYLSKDGALISRKKGAIADDNGIEVLRKNLAALDSRKTQGTNDQSSQLLLKERSKPTHKQLLVPEINARNSAY